MPIREVGFQLRDQSIQLQLEWDVSNFATFLATPVGNLDLTLTGSIFELAGAALADVEFHIAADTNQNAVIQGNVAGTGLLQINSLANAIDLSIADATVLKVSALGVLVTGTLESTGALTVGGLATFSGQIAGTDGIITAPSHTYSGALDQGMFRASDANVITPGGVSGEALRLAVRSLTGSPFLSFFQDITRRSFIQFNNAAASFIISADLATDIIEVSF